MTTHLLELDHIDHRYANGHLALSAFNLQVTRGEIACLLGPSGCGKTTALRVIAGFEPLQSGVVYLDGQMVSTPGHVVPPEKRNVGIVFQDAALFPHLSVADNIAFGLHRENRRVRRERIDNLLTMVNLQNHGTKYPHQLSGGQRQRVAIARAMAPKPALILLDEPFSNLDADLRQSLSADIRRILKDQGATAILVTHDQHEAFAMADRIALLRHGQIQQYATADELFHQPANRFVAGFIGEGCFVPAQATTNTRISCALGELSAINATVAEGWQGLVLLRPEDVRQQADGAHCGAVESVAFRGNQSLYAIRIQDCRILCYGRPGFHVGDIMRVQLVAEEGLIFNQDDVA